MKNFVRVSFVYDSCMIRVWFVYDTRCTTPLGCMSLGSRCDATFLTSTHRNSARYHLRFSGELIWLKPLIFDYILFQNSLLNNRCIHSWLTCYFSNINNTYIIVTSIYSANSLQTQLPDYICNGVCCFSVAILQLQSYINMSFVTAMRATILIWNCHVCDSYVVVIWFC